MARPGRAPRARARRPSQGRAGDPLAGRSGASEAARRARRGGRTAVCGAHRYAEQALIFEKDDTSALNCSSLANVALGRFDEGIAAAERAVALSHGGPHMVGLLGWTLATAGRKDEARKHLEELRARPADAPAVVSEGWLLGALGEIDAAFEVFARAADEYQGWLVCTRLPGFDLFRNDPRFTAMRSRLGLPVS